MEPYECHYLSQTLLALRFLGVEQVECLLERAPLVGHLELWDGREQVGYLIQTRLLVMILVEQEEEREKYANLLVKELEDLLME